MRVSSIRIIEPIKYNRPKLSDPFPKQKADLSKEMQDKAKKRYNF